MAVAIATPFGDPLPPFPKHAITVHFPGWSTILQIIEDPAVVIAKAKYIYPRFGPFAEVKDLIGRMCQSHLKPEQMCLIFASRDSAEACRDFAVSGERKEHRCEKDQIEIRAFKGDFELWATVFPPPKMPGVLPYWQDPGTGISGRIAQHCLDNFDSIKPVEVNAADGRGFSMDDPAYGTIKDRVVHQINRAPISARPTAVDSKDVFLFPTGMAAIYQTQRYITKSSLRPGSTVLFGFAFHSTPHVFKEYGENFKWFGKGDELQELEEFCQSEVDAGRQVQGVWLEFPTNPNLHCADLDRLRALADKFGFLLMIDDTISSFCSVDLLDHTDVVLTSLTKSFSGYSNVMAGSAVINPNSRYSKQLLNAFNQHFINELYVGDARALVENSSDYLERSTKLNANAFALVQLFEHYVNDASSSVTAVQYPTVGPNKTHYDAVKRPDSPDFTAGYGCLFSVEFESNETTIAFYEAVQTHKGPHLGANLTLALPYVKGILYKDMDWANQCGLNERQLRFSVGLEDTDALVSVFKEAVEAADKVKHKEVLDKLVSPIS